MSGSATLLKKRHFEKKKRQANGGESPPVSPDLGAKQRPKYEHCLWTSFTTVISFQRISLFEIFQSECSQVRMSATTKELYKKKIAKHFEKRKANGGESPAESPDVVAKPRSKYEHCL